MAARKLQQEIDKCFKKVAEGVQAFEAIHDKIQQCTNQPQKEKLEDQLKREIKKLQRLRDQIKSWASGNDIKDKAPLEQHRKLIESEMEKFKAVEKEMKTKAFSKEGLSAAAKLDPKEKEKEEAVEFLGEMIDKLTIQVEKLEADSGLIQNTMKKGKKDSAKAERLSELERRTEQHKWHQGRLELLRRALDNGNVEPEQLDGVKENILYYVDSNEDPEFAEDDEIYDEFNLDADEGAWGLANDVERVSSHDAQSAQDDGIDAAESRGGGTSTAKQKSADISSAPVRRPSNTLKSPLPALATLHTPLTTANSGSSSSSMKPAPLPTRPAGETLKYASAAAAAAASDKSGIAPLPPPPGASSTLAPLPPAPTKASATSSPKAPSSIPSTVLPQPSQRAAALTSTDTGSTSQPSTRSPTISHAATGSVPPTPALEKSETAGTSKGKVSTSLAATKEAQESSPELEHPRTPPSISDPRFASQTNGEPGIEEDGASIYHLPPGLEDLLQSFDITKSRVEAEPSQATTRLLDISHQMCPDPSEAEKPVHYKPKEKFNTPLYYPQDPSPIIDDPNLYSRIDTDTLFFIFYYRQGTYQQYLAAKSLKNQSWRFHKQYQTWFQRHEEPKTITEEFEQGTYRFFDYESTWMNRRKADFKFTYKFLEDDL